jgi:hypothetical protein
MIQVRQVRQISSENEFLSRVVHLMRMNVSWEIHQARCYSAARRAIYLKPGEVSYRVSSFEGKHKHCLHAPSSYCRHVISCGIFPIHDAAHGAFVTFQCHTTIREVSISSDEVQWK